MLAKHLSIVPHVVCLSFCTQRPSAGCHMNVQVPALLAGVAGKPQQQRDMLLRLAFAGLSPLSGPQAPRQGGAEDEAAFAAQYGFLADAADRAAFLDFGLKLLLYAPAHSPPPAAAAAGAAPNAAASPAPAGAIQPNAAAAAAAAAPGKIAPPGLSLADLQRIEGKAPPKGEVLTCAASRQHSSAAARHVCRNDGDPMQDTHLQASV